MSWRTAGGSGERAPHPRLVAGRLSGLPVSPAGGSLGAAVAVLALAGCALFTGPPPDTAADGSGHRAILDQPATMRRSECPEYRDSSGRMYSWDVLAYPSALAAELAHCSTVDPGPLGRWVVQERSDEQGNYSISAHLEAVSHSVVYDWRGFEPTLWVACWPGESEWAEPALEVSLWHFGPPQRSYGEPTPVRYQFDGLRASDAALWWGHSGQAEVVLLLPPLPEIDGQEADSHRFATEMRYAAALDEGSAPGLTVETWEGSRADRLGASQGVIEFDLLGLERAAFPVFDACGVPGTGPDA